MKSLFHGRSGKALPAEALTPTSHQKQRPPQRGAKENVDPGSAASPGENASLRAPSAAGRPPLAPKARSPLHPRPSPNTGDAPLKKKKLSMDALPEDGAPAAAAMDSGVQVIVRMRPLSKEEEGEGEQIVQKISSDSVSIIDHTFTFDSVADTRSTQEDIFQPVGLPLVENCLAGFNSSIFAYGQTGSGKTYTMWGPPSALLENGSPNAERGLTPRVFEQLFSRISEEQMKHSDEQRTYQCRCSFLEIYNEQIMDLLDPGQKNLQIREDVRTGVYVDCLSEEYVCTMKDVSQLLTKGLANRRIGATSINAESSRSHCVFTCVVESHSKNIVDGLNSLRISRINLVDLAGSERQKLTGAAGERLKEAGNINRSLSQLGNLINILAEVSQSGKQRHIPYRDSKLTFLLQESLGGNAKLAMICAISPSQSCKNETFSTLRFAQRAKAIKNKAVVNEITHDDVNVLREQIRQLKDELLRMKSNGISAGTNGSYSTAWNARRSLNLLRMSLGHPTVVSVNIIDDENDEDMEIDEEDAQRPCTQSSLQITASEENVNGVQKTPVRQVDSEESSLVNDDETTVYEQSCEPAVRMESCEPNDMTLNVASLIFDGGNVGYGSDSNREKLIKNEESSEGKSVVLQGSTSNKCTLLGEENSACSDTNAEKDSMNKSILDSCNISLSKSLHCDLSIVLCDPSPNLLSPTLSISPKADDNSKESHMIIASTALNDPLATVKPSSEDINLSFTQMNGSKRKSSLSPTNHLAASLHRGLQIIDSHQQKSPVGRSSCRFSFKPVDFKPFLPIVKIDIGTQTVTHESETLEDSPPFICIYCRNRAPPLEHKDATDNKQQQLVPPNVTDKTELQLIHADVTENKEMQLVPLDATDKKELQIVTADIIDNKELQLVPTDGSQSSDKPKKQVPKAAEKVLAGAIRREMALEDHCSKQMAEIVQLKRLIQQYKHERECNAIIGQTREDKICRLESLMDGILPTEDFMEEEFISLVNEHKLLKEKYDNHPELLRVNIEFKRVQDELEMYRNFFDLGEREVLLEEIQDLRNQLQYYIDSSPMPAHRRSSLLQLTHTTELIPAPLSSIPEPASECDNEKFEEERHHWTETESKWISLCEELRLELEASRSLAEKLKMELDSEKKCSEELKEALQTAMQGHARILDQYADLHEKHIALLARHQQIREGIDDVKRAASKAGIRGAESKFINSLAAQISVLKVEREKERQYWKEENKGLQAQLRDTAEAVQAAGELLVRLKEAEEATAISQKRTIAAEKEAEKAYQEIDNLKKQHKREIDKLNQFLAESRLPKGTWKAAYSDAGMVKYDGGNSPTDHQWREEFETFYRQDSEFAREAEQSSWFSGYDRCNI